MSSSRSFSDSSSAGCPTRVWQSWDTSATIVVLRGMCVPGITATHDSHEGCVNDRPDDVLHAHCACSPSARRRGQHGIWWTRTDAGRRSRAVGCAVQVVDRPHAACRAMRRAMGRSGARAVMTSFTARIARGERGQCLRVPGASLGSEVGPRAPYIACLTHLVGTLAAGVSAAGLWEILRSRKKISHFGLTSGATRRRGCGW